MKRDRLKKILQSHYKRNDWQNVIAFLSGNKNYYKPRLEPKLIVLSSQKANSIVKKLYELGTLTTSDGVDLPVFEIELQDNIKIEYNKVGVNQLIKEYILRDAGKGALASYFYEDENKTEWRFSFISKYGGSEFFAEVEDVETNPKKYTYIFGTKDEHRTALERLYNLEQSRFRIDDFFEAFNVEPVSNNFFKEYKDFYLDFVQHISTHEDCRKVFEAEETKDVEKDIRNFVKRLLGRIVFLYFLQKKSWLGASDTNYTDGDTNFLYHLFEADKTNFYQKWLSKLFFNALNREDRPNDEFELPDKSKVCIPFLNGGLFEEHQEPGKHKELYFPEFLFESLLSFFNGYNFTVYENSPDDHVVAVDPEMLSNIFENLLEDNKDKGAVYTPKDIVQYMTQESIIEYLNTHLDISKTLIENLVKKQVLTNISKEVLKKIDVLLDKVKICDPAIGSGAFPMGMLQEIFTIKALIHHELELGEWNPANVKLNIIQNSIYGVDIEEGAVDIARLRFWLSLVVDEDKPKPLPNLDYKIMQGNSLLESFEGIPLNNTDLFNSPTIKNITLFEEPIEDYNIGDDIKKLMVDYFNPENYKEKQAIHKAIDKKVIDYIDKCLEGFENQKLIELAGAKQTLKRRTELKQKTQPIHKEIKQIEETLNSKGNARKKLLEFEKKSERPYFLWHLFFKDVFDQGGFDIVVGNPPYRQIKWLNEKIELHDEGYETFSRSGDVYCLFYEKANKILRESGIGIYITSNKWLRADYGKELRNYLINNCNPVHLIDFAGFKVFETATVDTNILKWTKEDYFGLTDTTVIDNSFDIKNTISEFVKTNSIKNKFSSNKQWLSIGLTQLNIKNIIEKNSQTLLSIANLNYGILTGANKTFLIDKKKYQELVLKDNRNKDILKPILRGKDLLQYGFDFKDIYLINSHNGIKSRNILPVNVQEKYPSVLEYFESFGDKFKKRGEQGDNWYNLRNCAYLDEFEKNKIIYADIVQEKGKFFHDTSGFYTNDTAFIITGHNLKLLTAILNSTIASYSYKNFYSGGGLGDKGLRFKKEFLGKIPIPNHILNKSVFDLFVDIIQLLKLKKTQQFNETIKNEHVAQFFEEVVDACVFELYFKEHMHEREINIIDMVQKEIIKVFEAKNFDNLDEQTKKQNICSLYKNLKNSEVQQRTRLFVAKSPNILKPILQSYHE